MKGSVYENTTLSERRATIIRWDGTTKRYCRAVYILMGLFRRKKKFISVSEPEPKKTDPLDDNFNDENAPVLPDEIKKTETNPTTTTEKGKDDLDEVFFAALDYMTAPERNYLTNIQRGPMDKQ